MPVEVRLGPLQCRAQAQPKKQLQTLITDMLHRRLQGRSASRRRRFVGHTFRPAGGPARRSLAKWWDGVRKQGSVRNTRPPLFQSAARLTWLESSRPLSRKDAHSAGLCLRTMAEAARAHAMACVGWFDATFGRSDIGVCFFTSGLPYLLNHPPAYVWIYTLDTWRSYRCSYCLNPCLWLRLHEPSFCCTCHEFGGIAPV
jgi:hypothetical protein